jgi:hypothetical protein
MKVLKSPLTKEILLDPKAARALVNAVLTGGTFQFKGKTYRAEKVPKASED